MEVTKIVCKQCGGEDCDIGIAGEKLSWGTVYINISGGISFSYDDDIEEHDDLLEAIKKVPIEKGSIFSCMDCQDECSATAYFNDGSSTDRPDEVLRIAFPKLLGISPTSEEDT